MMRILIVLTLALTSCSEGTTPDEEVKDPVAQTVEFGEGGLSSNSGTGTIFYSGAIATKWSAEITEGGDYASFSSNDLQLTKSGIVTSAEASTLYYYYEENKSSETEASVDRQIEITFTFDGSEPVVIDITQLSQTSEDSPYFKDSTPRFNEIPAMVDNDDYIYVTHTTSLNNGTDIRNFSLCFDIENHAAAWVAFPYHRVFDGDAGRNESWTYDPKIPEEYQPNLKNSYSGSYDRGHQMASADRQATSEMNRQTFYFSNMTPQLGTLNQRTWATFETAVRRQVCTDTLFVVTGADYNTTIGTTTDRDGMVCPLPGAYYKVMLRTKSGNTGKAVTECDASELQAIGFWFEHRAYDEIPTPVSVATIEERTGFDFFPNVPDEVKESYSSDDWNF